MLKYYREKRKMTQQQLADKAEIAIRTVQRIERTNKTDVGIAIKIAKILEYPVEVIFKEKENDI